MICVAFLQRSRKLHAGHANISSIGPWNLPPDAGNIPPDQSLTPG
jgi:hypothetical protein